MYRPPYTREDDPAVAQSVMLAHPFATLATVDSDGALQAGHLPLLWEDGALVGHLARNNPQARAAAQALAVFHGPDAYVSPTWYGRPSDHVPTWNYVAVQVRGSLEVLTPDQTLAALERLVAHFEPEWRVSPALATALVGAIVGLRLRPTTVACKLKLSQNRDADDSRRVAQHLSLLHPELSAWMPQPTPPPLP
jgi:transcriptional regulator